MEKMVRPVDHKQRGRKKRNMLSFRLELAKELVGSFSSRQRVGGRPRSSEHELLDRLNPNLGHWPMHVSRKGNCTVCLAMKRKQGLSSVGNCHESRIQCEHCRVYLCVSTERNCFKKYHTLVNYS